MQLAKRWKMARTLRSLGLLLVAVALVAAGAPRAFAASNKGTIRGIVKDKDTGAPIAGVTVVAQGPQGELAEVTDDKGNYTITEVPVGKYLVVFFVPGGNAPKLKKEAQVSADATIPVNASFSQKEEASKATEKVIEVVEKAPQIDIGSTKRGTKFDREFMNKVPARGRDFESLIESTPGASGDDNGVSLGGAQSVENNYVIDGVNVTGIGFGTLGTSLNVDFIQEVEVITGGYNAEYGRATGGIVNVTTKSGSNEFHASVSAHYTPGWGRALADEIVTKGGSLVTRRTPQAGDYDLQLFADISGPIVKDKVFFYAGVSPIFTRDTITRSVRAIADRYNNASCQKQKDIATNIDDPQALKCFMDVDGTAIPGGGRPGLTYQVEQDPMNRGHNRVKMKTVGTGASAMMLPVLGGDGQQDFIDGQYVSDNLGANKLFQTSNQAFQFNTKLSFVLSPEHSFDVSYFGNPEQARGQRLGGTPTPFQVSGGSHDANLKWISKLFEKKLQIEAIGSYHRERNVTQAFNGEGESPLISWLAGANGRDPTTGKIISSGARTLDPRPGIGFAGETERYGYDKLAPCIDDTSGQLRDANGSPVDPYPLIQNCRVLGYSQGGLGLLERTIAQRYGGRLVARYLGLKAVGLHDFKGGWDPEYVSFDDVRRYTGGSLLEVRSANVRQNSYTVARPNPLTGEEQFVNAPFRAQTSTINHAFFVQDQWQAVPGQLTFNLGVRFERQDIRDLNGNSGLVVSWNTAPRLGFIYDPTGEGRSKLFGSFARFYESIPMDINNRSFGREGLRRSVYPAMGPAACPGLADSGGNFIDGTVDCNRGTATNVQVLGGRNAVPMPDLAGQYNDEMTIGGEYEVIEDLALGVSFTRRYLGSIIEDASVDNAAQYYIVNPGETVTNEQVNKIKDQARAAEQASRTFRAQGDLVRANDAQARYEALAQFAAVAKRFGQFPKAERDFYQVTGLARKRFSRNWQLQSSYTYSRAIGNYGGLFSAETGQLDPNITSQFDLPDLLANRVGPLGSDRPHAVKIDGSYEFKIGTGSLIAGTSFRVNSGVPQNALGAHNLYGFDESYVLPRGTTDRLPMTWRADIQLMYQQELAKNMRSQFYLQLFNILNNQGEVQRDDRYTFDAVNPIINGNQSDLRHLRHADDESLLAQANPNWRNKVVLQTPFFMRVGVRLEF